ncbi:hypothetical protein DXT66_27265 [Nocardia farcinica]|nr:hypothetical protein DXT66_27265 [Nocardia farcinica]
MSRQFWHAAAERAVKTFAQTLLALLSAVSTGALITGGIPWAFVVGAVGVAAWAAALSLLSSVVSTTVGDPESPSLLRPEPRARHGLPTDLG